MVESSKSAGHRLSDFFWKMAPSRMREWKTRIDLARLTYRHCMNREANLVNPVRFSEKIQWRKLFEASSLYTKLSDKIAVRDHITEKGFSSLLIPQLWVGDEPSLIPFDDFAPPFVLKSTHAYNQTVFIRPDQAIDREQIVSQARGWLAYCHGTAYGEPGYLDVPHRLVIEPLLVCADGEPPMELKVFVFHGVARYVQFIIMQSDRDQRFAYLDRDWKQCSWHTPRVPIEIPEKRAIFERAFSVAEKLCENMDHCRVDFYLRDNDLYVGEMTLYSFSGIITLKSPDADAMMGSFWTLRWPRTRAMLAILTRRWGRA